MTAVAGVVVETLPGRVKDVAARLAIRPGLTVRGDDGDRRIAAVFAAADGEALESLSAQLLADDDAIVGLFPTFVGHDPE